MSVIVTDRSQSVKKHYSAETDSDRSVASADIFFWLFPPIPPSPIHYITASIPN